MNESDHLDRLITRGPYSLDQPAKTRIVLPALDRLTRYHYARSEPFRNVVDRAFGGLPRKPYGQLAELPFLPVSLFKTHTLRSIPDEDVFKVLKSSGTTTGQVSRVYLDRQSAADQSRVLVKLLQYFLGKKRLPMVVVDAPNVVEDRRSFSARGAGILGMMQFGYRPIYALRDDMSLDEARVRDYLDQHRGRPILFFGFTFIVWRHLIEPLRRRSASLEADDGILIHSGGWKKLESHKVSRAEFNRTACDVTGARRCVNFYGMVEQIGSVFLENPLGHLHAPLFSDVIIRDPHSLRPLPDGQTGLVQVLSVLPRSYPGHSILTEDLGRIVGCDHPALEMRGRYFEIQGRVPKAVVRGCSDTYEFPEDRQKSGLPLPLRDRAGVKGVGHERSETDSPADPNVIPKSFSESIPPSPPTPLPQAGEGSWGGASKAA